MPRRAKTIIEYEDLLFRRFKQKGACYDLTRECCIRAGIDPPVDWSQFKKHPKKEIDQWVRHKEPKAGDIVCFKEGSVRHLGFMLDSERFIHSQRGTPMVAHVWAYAPVILGYYRRKNESSRIAEKLRDRSHWRGVKLTVFRNPMDPRDKEETFAPCSGEALRSYLPKDIDASRYRVFLNARAVKDIDKTIPHDGQHVVLRLVPNPFIGPILAIVLVVATVAMVAYSIIRMVLNAVSDHSVPEADSSPTYGWGGARMTTKPGGPIQKNYGDSLRVGPQVIESYTMTSGGKQYLRLLCSFGHGPFADFKEIEINSQPIENYPGVVVHKRLGRTLQSDGGSSKPVIPLFQETHNLWPVSGGSGQKMTVGSAVTINGVRSDTTAMEIEFQFPRGIFHQRDDGGFENLAISAKIEYKKHADPSWLTLLHPRTWSGVSASVYWMAVEFGQYTGGPYPNMVVYSTSTDPNAHTEGEVYTTTANVPVYDVSGAFVGNEDRTVTCYWTKNPGYLGSLAQQGATPVSPATWSQQSYSISKNQSTTVHDSVRINFPEAGQWDIRVTKLGSGTGHIAWIPWSGVANHETDARYAEEMWVMATTECAPDAIAYNGLGLLGIEALATEHLSGSLNVTAIPVMDVPETAGYLPCVLMDDPQIFLRLGDPSGTTATDSSRRGRNGTYVGSPGLGAAGLVGGSANTAMTLDGGGDYVTLPGSIPSSGTNWQIEMLVRFDTNPPGAGWRLVQTSVSDPIFIDSNRKLSLWFSGAGHASATALSVGVAHHLVVDCKGGTVSFYIDGVRDANTYSYSTNMKPTRISDDTFGFVGTVDEFAYYVPRIPPGRFRTHWRTAMSKHNSLESYSCDNPAIACWDIATNIYYGGSVPFSSMDRRWWKQWAEFSTELLPNGRGGYRYRNAFSAVFDAASGDVWGAMNKIAAICNVGLLRTGINYTGVIDKTDDPVAVFNVSDIIKDSFQHHWTTQEERANSIDIEFNNKLDKSNRTRITVQDDEAISQGARIVKTSIDGFGIVDMAEAITLGNFLVAKGKNVTEVVQWEASIDAIGCAVGDVVYVQHDLPGWAVGGRMEDGSTTTHLHLDRAVTMVGGHSYQVMVLLSSVERASGTVTSVSGDTVTIGGGYAGTHASRFLVPSKNIDVEVVAYGVGYVQVADATNIAAADSYELWENDVLETKGVTTVAGNQTQIDITSALSSAPEQFAMWCFYEVGVGMKKVRLQEVGISRRQTAELNGVEYVESIYSEIEPSAPTVGGTRGPFRPGAGADETSVGTRAWSSPGSILLSDDAYASATNSTDNVTEYTHYLLIGPFNPRLKTDDYVLGFKLELERKAIVAAGGHVYDEKVYAYSDGATVGSNKSAAAEWSTTEGYVSFGGEEDTWGAALSNSKMNGIYFVVQAKLVTAAGMAVSQALVDSARLTVYIDAASGAIVSDLRVTEMFPAQ